MGNAVSAVKEVAAGAWSSCRKAFEYTCEAVKKAFQFICDAIQWVFLLIRNAFQFTFVYVMNVWKNIGNQAMCLVRKIKKKVLSYANPRYILPLFWSGITAAYILPLFSSGLTAAYILPLFSSGLTAAVIQVVFMIWQYMPVIWEFEELAKILFLFILLETQKIHSSEELKRRNFIVVIKIQV